MKGFIWCMIGVIIADITAGAIYVGTTVSSQLILLDRAKVAALHGSQIRTIDHVWYYTGGPDAYVCLGKDATGNEMVVTESTHGTTSEYLSTGVSESAVEKLVRSQVGIVQMEHITPGPVLPNVKTLFSSQATGSLVWEVYGLRADGHYAYAYVDFYTGTLLWSFVLAS